MIGVLVSGEGTNLQALIDAGLEIRAVASNRRDAGALGRARAARIPTATFSLDCHETREERDLVMATWLEEHGVELVVLAGYMHLLTPAFLARFPGRVLNVHPSLLPAFPGAHAIDDALAAGIETTGVTVHVVDEGLDTGPVLRQEPLPVEPRETLVARIHAVEHRLLPAVVRERLDALAGPRPSASSGTAGKGGKRATRGTARPGTAAGRERRILPLAAPGGGGALRRASADAAEEGEAPCAR